MNWLLHLHPGNPPQVVATDNAKPTGAGTQEQAWDASYTPDSRARTSAHILRCMKHRAAVLKRGVPRSITGVLFDTINRIGIYPKQVLPTQ